MIRRTLPRKCGPRFLATHFENYRFRSASELNYFLWQLADWRSRDLLRECFRLAKSNLCREHGLGSSTVRGEVERIEGPEPAPPEAAAALEEWETLLSGESPRDQHILIMLRQGDSCDDVARKLGIAPGRSGGSFTGWHE